MPPTVIDGTIPGSQALKYPLSVSLPVPTFASFLKEVDSPYEVHDYVRAYLGDTPEAKDFAKQFLERRAKQNTNQQKQVPQNQQQALKQQQVSDTEVPLSLRFSMRAPNFFALVP